MLWATFIIQMNFSYLLVCNGAHVVLSKNDWDIQRHASNNNIMGESGSLARRYARPSRESRDYNANIARTHSRLAHAHAHMRHDNTLDIILKPLIESTQ